MVPLISSASHYKLPCYKKVNFNITFSTFSIFRTFRSILQLYRLLTLESCVIKLESQKRLKFLCVSADAYV